MSYTVDAEIHPADDAGNTITVLNDITVEWQGRTIVVPVGFESDGVSCPRCLWRLVSPCIYPETLRAGLAHDYLYRGNNEGWTRAEADKMFRDICVEDGLSKWRANIAYAGLRAFGGKNWVTNDN